MYNVSSLGVSCVVVLSCACGGVCRYSIMWVYAFTCVLNSCIHTNMFGCILYIINTNVMLKRITQKNSYALVFDIFVYEFFIIDTIYTCTLCYVIT